MFGWKRLRALFKRPGPMSSEDSAARVAAIVEYMRERERPCLHLSPAAESGGSWLGGAPSLAPGQAWPRWQDIPFSFLAQLDLAEARQAGGPEWLPDRGCLQVFFDPTRFDHQDRSAWIISHLSAETATAPAAEPHDLPAKRRYKPRPIRYEAATSYPLYDRSWHLTRDFSEAEDAAVEAALGFVEQVEPAHRIGGYPRPIQSDFMEAECQHAWNDEFAPELERPRNLASRSEGETDHSPPGFDEWRLLLQLDSDERMGTNWGDGGTLYFWIREQDARAGDFSRVWVTMQCY